MASAGKRGLGRGLDALLGIGSHDDSATAAAARADHGLRNLPVDLIQRGRYQPRVDFAAEALQELADSIKAQGVVQPIVVRRLPGHAHNAAQYEIIAGERRWRAAQMAGLHEIPALVRDVDDRTAMSVALIENIQRKDLNAIEEAGALNRLVNEFGLTHQEVANAVGRSRAAVSNLLRLLDLAEPVRQRLARGEIEMGHARALLALPSEQQDAAARRIVAHGMSVRQAEQMVKQLQRSPVSTAKPGAVAADPDIRRLEQDLGERLGAKVALKHSARGGGTLIVHYHTLDELDGILAHIK